MLVKNGNYIQIIETTEKKENIIKNAHEIKLIGHQKVFKPLKKIQKNDIKKHQSRCGKIYQKLPNLRNKKTRPFTQKKITSIFTTVRNIFSETCTGFRYRVTGITKPNDRKILRYDLHDNRRINKIRKICFMQNNDDNKKKIFFFFFFFYGSRYF